MQKFNQFIFKYLLYSFPLVITVAIWSSLKNDFSNSYSGLMSFLWEALSFNFIFWMCCLFYFFLSLLFSKTIRENLLSKLALMKNRDEREQQITGHAARYTFLSTFALLLFLLFTSVLQVNISAIPSEQIKADGAKHTLSIGMQYAETKKLKESQESIFNYDSFPLSKAGIILLVLFWHVLSFMFFSRKNYLIEN